MLVDDDIENLTAMGEALGGQDFGCIEAHSDPRRALARAAEGVFDTIITECRVAGSIDLEFIQRVRGLQSHATITLVTSVRDPNVLFEAVNTVGVLRVLGKPWSCDTLCEAVAEALIQREYRTRLARMQDLVLDQQRVIERQADILLRLEVAHPGITSSL
jgi:response regulator RpfG family c-di-GMP phosphodiesterase